LGDQLAAHLGSRQPRVETRGAKLRVGLALSIHDGREIAQQVGQVLFTALATTQAEAVNAGQSLFHLLCPFADGLPIPAQLAFGQPLTAFAQGLHRARHEHAPRAPLEVLGCVPQQCFDLLRQFQQGSSKKSFLGAVYHLWDNLVFASPLVLENARLSREAQEEIAERKQAEAKLRQLEQRKDEFISMASHELKTPVTSLKGFTHILQRRLAKQGDEQVLHFIARMDAQLDKLTKLISDLLDVSRMQTGKLTFQEEPFDLTLLVQESVENLQAGTQTHQLLFERTGSALVYGDKDRLGQVLINLFTNAIKYSPAADKVLVRVSTDQDTATVSVQDFGIGIAESHHEYIFERFYQVSDPMEKTYPGLGIGLFISNEIVIRHHGRLWVESIKGQGSTFSFTLPLFREK
jgi:signal transduction histidine kinase